MTTSTTWAVVAGASEGLGAAWAEALAERGFSLILLARRVTLLEQTAATLRDKYGVEIKTESVDLGDPTLAATLQRLIEGIEVSFGVYNAAAASRGPFLESRLQTQLTAIDVNCRGPVIFSHVLGQPMAARGRGQLVLMSSLTAFQGSPFLATYGATKAFVLGFGEALWFELRARGVEVLVCAAGATRTPNLLAAAPKGEVGMLEPAQVVAEALAVLGRRPSMIPGVFNRFASFAMRRVMTRDQAVGVLGRRTQQLLRGVTS